MGVHAPGRVDKNGTNAYTCSYNIIKAHAAAYHVYNNTYRATQQGMYNVTLGIRGGVSDDHCMIVGVTNSPSRFTV